ncbi:hypothetical protein [Streptomyces yerevanensis]|uniref:hypothetical protein n=1 Tax=Streptomyces yerevanensis TaxID=66378 RepID=UPI0006905778|nr:hypothetical protein [Streptomyces yerevanensis]
MKLRTETHVRHVPHTIDGVTHDVPEHYAVTIPALPRDWDRVALRAAASLVLALTLISVIWSTYSIGVLLGRGIGFAAAVVFDLAWMVNILLEWLSRFDPAKRGFSKRLGWALLAATMGAILWHGLSLGSPALGVVGAGVSLFAKTLWFGVMRFIDRDLSEADAAWVQQEMSRANAALAVADVRRQVARAEDRAAAELLAAEQIRTRLSNSPPTVSAYSANTAAEQPNIVSEQDGNEEPERPTNVPLTSPNNGERSGTSPSIAHLAREQLHSGVSNAVAVANILQIRLDANPDSVGATVRRERSKGVGYL